LFKVKAGTMKVGADLTNKPKSEDCTEEKFERFTASYNNNLKSKPEDEACRKEKFERFTANYNNNANDDEEEDDEKKKAEAKKMQDKFLTQAVKITDANAVDEEQLLEAMIFHFKKELSKWSLKWKSLKIMNSLVTFIVMLINFVVVLLFQIPIDANLRKTLAMILPVVSSLLIAFQNKLAWETKAAATEKSVIFYKKLTRHLKSRLEILRAGAEVTDVFDFVNSTLIAEMSEVPQALLAY